MINIRELEDLRTKEELIAYFKRNGINITEEQITKLKQNYENICEDKNKLTLEQLDNVAGGLKFITCETHESFIRNQNFHQACTYGDGVLHIPKDKNGKLIINALAIPNGANGGLVVIFDGANNHGFTLSSAEGENSSYRENSVILSQTLASLNNSNFDKICTDLSGNNVSTWDLQQFKSLYEVANAMHKNGNNKTISINSNSNNSNIKDIVGFLIGGLAITGVCLAVGFLSNNDKNKK